MKKYFYVYILFLIQDINSYITFPLLKDIPSFSKEETPSEIIEKLFDSNLYIKMIIGSENTEVKTYLSNQRHELMIAGNKIKNHKYNENKSLSYKCTYCNEKEFPYGDYNGGIISTENFKIKFNGKEIKTINRMNFILGTNSPYMNPPEAFVGLILPYFDSELNYNLFKSLKLTNSTNTYNWYLNFTENDSKMFIDIFPHKIENNKYDIKKLVTTEAINDGYFLIWGLLFTSVYYDNKKYNISTSDNIRAKIDFSKNYILAPNDTGIYIENIFFNEYYQKNICFKKSINNNKQYFIYCKNSNEFDPKNFKNIYFKSLGLSSIFEFNYKDLFFYKDNYIYFLVLFQEETYWTFGELFLKKYLLIFEHDKKTISFYKNNENKDDENNENENNKGFNYNILYISLLSFIFIGIIVVIVIVILKKGKRKNRANELVDDDFDYTSDKNNDKLDKIIKTDDNLNDNNDDNKILPNN